MTSIRPHAWAVDRRNGRNQRKTPLAVASNAIAAVLWSTVIAQPVLALSIEDRPVAELFADADLVVSSKLYSVEGDCRLPTCSYRYRMQVTEWIMPADASAAELVVCSWLLIPPGRQYTVFQLKADSGSASEDSCDVRPAHDGIFQTFQRNPRAYRISSNTQSMIQADGRIMLTHGLQIPDFQTQLETARRKAERP